MLRRDHKKSKYQGVRGRVNSSGKVRWASYLITRTGDTEKFKQKCLGSYGSEVEAAWVRDLAKKKEFDEAKQTATSHRMFLPKYNFKDEDEFKKALEAEMEGASEHASSSGKDLGDSIPPGTRMPGAAYRQLRRVPSKRNSYFFNLC